MVPVSACLATETAADGKGNFTLQEVQAFSANSRNGSSINDILNAAAQKATTARQHPQVPVVTGAQPALPQTDLKTRGAQAMGNTLRAGTPSRGVSSVVVAHDPNAIIGPAGYGAQGFIQPPAGPLSYAINFENDGTAATQVVTVTAQLDPDLNWSTFQFGSFGFGPIDVTVPAGLSEYQTTVRYENTDGSLLDVAVALEFNVQTGQLTATYTSLDPTTGQAPDGVFDGFLYPESQGVVNSEGFVQYTCQAKAGLANGVAINQAASVVFDTNAALVTSPAALNTIDATVPTSSVAALAASEPATFTVQWSGQDTGGSGIASYDVYDAVNGGAYALWQTNTTATSALFTGQGGDTYTFYSVATSNVGAVQATPAAAQAKTTVNAALGTMGVYSGGYWYINVDGTMQIASVPAAWAAATPITGDWNGTGKTEIGLFNSATATWWLNTAGDGKFKTSETFAFGFGGSNVFPVVGDWNGGGKTEVGVYCNGAWFRDYDNSHTWDATNAATMAYLGWNDGGTNTAIPVPGQWAGDGKTEMGVYCQGVWFLDSTGSGQWDGGHTYWGWAGTLTPVVGNWTGSATKSQFGVYNQGAWFLDYDNSHLWDAANQAALTFYGWTGRSPWWAIGAAGFKRPPGRRHPASWRRCPRPGNCRRQPYTSCRTRRCSSRCPRHRSPAAKRRNKPRAHWRSSPAPPATGPIRRPAQAMGARHPFQRCHRPDLWRSIPWRSISSTWPARSNVRWVENCGLIVDPALPLGTRKKNNHSPRCQNGGRQVLSAGKDYCARPCRETQNFSRGSTHNSPSRQEEGPTSTLFAERYP